MKWSFSYISFVKCIGQKKLGSHNKIVLYPNLCYNEVLHKGTALRTVVSKSCVLAHLYQAYNDHFRFYLKNILQ